MADKRFYTVEAGRQILRDGVRVATVYSKVQTREKDGLFPADADDFTHEIAKILNAYPKLLEFVRLVAIGDAGSEGARALLKDVGA